MIESEYQNKHQKIFEEYMNINIIFKKNVNCLDIIKKK